MIAAAAQCSEMISPLQRAGRPLGVQSSTASLEITSSTSRETSGKPEFMPKASRSMLVFAEEGEPRRAPAHFALHRHIDAERPRHAEERQFAGHADRVVVNLLDRTRDEVDRGKTRRIEERHGAQVVVERRRADVHRLRLHMERHAALVRVVEIDRDAPLKLIGIGRACGDSRRRRWRRRYGFARDRSANWPTRQRARGLVVRMPSARTAQTMRTRWINLSWLVMRLLIFVRMNIRGGRLIRFRSSTSLIRYVR